jgi:hypothetical protein
MSAFTSIDDDVVTFAKDVARQGAQSPVTIEHRGALYLTATGQLPRAPDCIDTEFCRCDVCARLKDLGYGSRAEYLSLMMRDLSLSSSAAARAEARRERIKRRSQKANLDVKRGTPTPATTRTVKPVFSPLSPSATVATSTSQRKDRKMYGAPSHQHTSPRLAPSKREPLPRSAGRVPARHDIMSVVVPNPCRTEDVGSAGSRGWGESDGNKSSRSVGPAPSRGSTPPRTPPDGRHARRMPWERQDNCISPASRMKMRKEMTRKVKPRHASSLSAKLSLDDNDDEEEGKGKKGGSAGGSIAPKSPSEMDAHRRREMAKIVPTTELTKSELVALVLAARCADIGEEVKKTEIEAARAKAAFSSRDSAAAEKPTAELAAAAALRAENKALKEQLKVLEGKLRHESAVSRQLCVQVSRMKAESK